ncbi:MAG TPA: DUF4197 domain-containing protein [Burkholderiales bacterium]|nr:DUF4197 domain-containing protein [Burkholderiales bacterium]
MKSAIVAALAAALMTCAAPAMARLEQLSVQDAVAGLKAALEKGSRTAVASLGRTDGFLRNPRVKIPLPKSLAKAESLMRRLGARKYADELIVAMNRAAEQAVPEARQLLLDAVRKMSVRDAKGLLTGGNTAATDYFRRTTRTPLHARLLPIVRRATGRVGLAQTYKRYAGKAAGLGLLDRDESDLDEYVTQRALDALFLMIADEEKKIRRNPLGAGSKLLGKVFGALQ